MRNRIVITLTFVTRVTRLDSKRSTCLQVRTQNAASPNSIEEWDVISYRVGADPSGGAVNQRLQLGRVVDVEPLGVLHKMGRRGDTVLLDVLEQDAGSPNTWLISGVQENVQASDILMFAIPYHYEQRMSTNRIENPHGEEAADELFIFDLEIMASINTP